MNLLMLKWDYLQSALFTALIVESHMTSWKVYKKIILWCDNYMAKYARADDLHLPLSEIETN